MTLRLRRGAMAVVALFGLVACGSDSGDDFEIKDRPLQGLVNGSAWMFQAGETDAFLSEGDDNFFATLYDQTYEECGFTQPDGPSLIVAVPKQPGEYDFSLSLNMTFEGNLIAVDGIIVVDEVTDTTVSGGLHGVFDDDNEVSGNFALTVCADSE